MLQRLDKSDVEGSGTADSITASPSEKRPRGRPKGSRSRRSRESQEVVNEYAPRVWERIARKALGLPVYSEPGEGGRRARRYPSEEDEQACQRLIAERSLPSLKASERTIDQTVRKSILPDNIADLALSVGGNAADQAEAIRLALGGEPAQLESITDSDEADAPAATALAGAGGGTSAPPASLPEPSSEEMRVGDVEEISGERLYLQCIRGGQGRPCWTIVRSGVMTGAEYATREAARSAACSPVGLARVEGGGTRADERPWPRQRPTVHLGYRQAKGR